MFPYTREDGSEGEARARIPFSGLVVDLYLEDVELEEMDLNNYSLYGTLVITPTGKLEITPDLDNAVVRVLDNSGKYKSGILTDYSDGRCSVMVDNLNLTIEEPYYMEVVLPYTSERGSDTARAKLEFYGPDNPYDVWLEEEVAMVSQGQTPEEYSFTGMVSFHIAPEEENITFLMDNPETGAVFTDDTKTLTGELEEFEDRRFSTSFERMALTPGEEYECTVTIAFAYENGRRQLASHTFFVTAPKKEAEYLITDAGQILETKNPGEYSYTQDFRVSSDSKEVSYLVDLAESSAQIYNPDGKYIATAELSNVSDDLYRAQAEGMWMEPGETYTCRVSMRILILDENLEIVDWKWAYKIFELVATD